MGFFPRLLPLGITNSGLKVDNLSKTAFSFRLVLLDVNDGVLAVVLGVVTRDIGQLHHFGAGHYCLRRPSGQFAVVILDLSRQHSTTLTFKLLSPVSGNL